MLKNWLKIFLYNLKRSKTFSTLTIIGLSFGICAVVLASLYWKQEHSYDQWNPNKENIYEVLMDMGEGKIWTTNVGPLAEQIKNNSTDSLEYLYYYGWIQTYSFKINGLTKNLEANLVQSNFFNFFPFEISKGSQEAFAEKPRTVALSEEEAIRLFGDENPIGKTFTNEENKTYSVTTVYKLNPNSTFAPECIINDLEINTSDWNNFNWQLLIKVKNPESIPTIKAQTEKIIQKNLIEVYAKRQGMSPEAYIEKFGGIKPIFSKLMDARLFNKNSGLPNHQGNYTFLLINNGISILILILSIVNQINLNTAYALKRLKEFGVRKIIGASKKNLILQLIFETSIYLFAAFILAFALIELLIPHYNSLLNHKLQFNIAENLILVISIFFAILVLSAVIPALFVIRIPIQKSLRKQSNNTSKNEITRNTLLVLQFVISFIFICAGLISYRQVDYMMNKDLGFSGDQVIAIEYNNFEKTDRFAYYEQIMTQLQQIKGVQSVAGSNLNIGYGSPQSSRLLYKEAYVQGRIVYCEYDFLDMLNIKILEGRNFDRKFASDSINTVVLNQTAVNELGISNPINQSITWNGEPYQIVGVVEDFHATGFISKIPANMFIRGGENNYVRNNIQTIYVKLDASHIEKSISAIEKLWNEKIDPYYPMKYQFVNKAIDHTYRSYVHQRNLFGVLNIVVISISIFGLFALASFSIERRLKEIAIKKVLGANTAILIKDLSLRYIWICIIGFLLALLPSYYFLQEWLSNFAYRIEIDYLLFILSFVFMLLMTLIIVVYKAYSATRINPLHYLKYE